MTRGTRAVVTLALAVALGGAGIAVWLVLDGLDGLDGPATWLTVEAPVHAVAGQPYPMRITVKGVPAGTWLVAGLHGSDANGVSSGFLSGGGTALVVGDGPYSFAAPVRDRENLRFVTVVAYFGPTTRWADHRRSATSGLIRVKAEGPTPSMPLTRLAVYEQREGQPPDHATTFGRLALAVLLAAFAALAAGQGAANSRLRGFWIGLAVAALAAAAWELSGAGSAATQLGRLLAEERDWYNLRRPFQKALVALLAAGGGAAMLAAPHIGRSLGLRLRLSILCILLYALLAAVDLLSLHKVDTLVHRAVGPVSLMQALKAACVALAVLAAAWPLARGMILRRRHP